jgi:hypothetical protein
MVNSLHLAVYAYHNIKQRDPYPYARAVQPLILDAKDYTVRERTKDSVDSPHNISHLAPTLPHLQPPFMTISPDTGAV